MKGGDVVQEWGVMIPPLLWNLVKVGLALQALRGDSAEVISAVLGLEL